MDILILWKSFQFDGFLNDIAKILLTIFLFPNVLHPFPADHIGAVGASYGGLSVYWLAGHHEGRFAALIAHAGIFNIESQYLETEEMWFANWDMGGAY